MSAQTITFHGFAPFEKGRVRNLRYDINALADFEQLTGMGFGQLMSMKAMFATCRALLFAGLKHEDRTLTVEKVGELIQNFIDDERNPNADIDYLVEKALEAAVAQGALGQRARKQAAEAEARKNAPALALVESTQPQPSSPSPLPDIPGSVVG